MDVLRTAEESVSFLPAHQHSIVRMPPNVKTAYLVYRRSMKAHKRNLTAKLAAELEHFKKMADEL